jgi:hypothetical protein
MIGFKLLLTPSIWRIRWTSLPRRDDLEHVALQIVINSGREGIIQSDLWRKLDASSREGSRVSLKLESKGLIRREKEMAEGRWTYRLYPKRQPISIDSVLTQPCLLCALVPKCEFGGSISPTTCELLRNWLMELASKSGGT